MARTKATARKSTGTDEDVHEYAQMLWGKTVSQLNTMLQANGLQKHGLKKVLIGRLVYHRFPGEMVVFEEMLAYKPPKAPKKKKAAPKENYYLISEKELIMVITGSVTQRVYEDGQTDEIVNNVLREMKEFKEYSR